MATPSARHDAAFVYDISRSVIVMFGGKSGVTFLGDTWELNINNGVWTQIFPTTSPSARSSAWSGWVNNRNVVIVHGGQTASGIVADTWEYSPSTSTWIQKTPATVPTAAANTGTGGSGGLEWHHLNSPGVMRWGGWTGTAVCNEIWTYDGVNWQFISMRAPVPPATVGGMWKQGDFHQPSPNNSFYLGDTVEFGGGSDLSTLATPSGTQLPDVGAGNQLWRTLTPHGGVSPGPVRNATSITTFDGNGNPKILVVGGRWGTAGTSGTVQSVQWRLDVETDAFFNQDNFWHQDTTITLPTAREQAMGTALNGSTAFLFGGLDASGVELSDLWYYDGSSWVAFGPTPRIPTVHTFAAGNGAINVSWSVATPTYSIDTYTITASNGFTITVPWTSNNQSYIVTGLTNEVTYTFTVTANNASGSSLPGSATGTPHATVPDAPTSLTAVNGNTTERVCWQPPTNDGGLPITQYRIVASYFDFNAFIGTTDADVTVPASQLCVTLTGLQNDRIDLSQGTDPYFGYAFYVSAINAIGQGNSARIDGFPSANAIPPAPPVPLYNPTHGVPGDTLIVIPQPNTSNANTLSSWAASADTTIANNIATLSVKSITGAISTLTSATTFKCADISVDFATSTSSGSSGTSNLAVFGLDDGTGNSAYIMRKYNAQTKCHTFECSLQVGNGEVLGSLLAAQSLSGSLRIITALGYVYIYCKDGLLNQWQLAGVGSGWPASSVATARLKVASDTETITTTFSNFLAAPGIMFNTIPAINTIALPTFYSALVPPRVQTGPVDLTLFDETGILAQAPHGFTYDRGGANALATDGLSVLYLILNGSVTKH